MTTGCSIAESGARRVLVYDLWARRLLARIALPERPLDLVRRGRRMLVLLDGDAGVAEIEDRALRRVLALPLLPAGAQARRLAVSPPGDALALLSRGPGAEAWVLRVTPALAALGAALPEPGASDVEWSGNETLVVARAPGQTFVRLIFTDAGVVRAPGLAARGYDGLGIVRGPAGIVYGAGDTLRVAVRARVHYRRSGSVTTYRLDAGVPVIRWGRLFLDACLPEGTRVRARFLTSEEPDGPGELERTPPANAAELDVPVPELSPPLPWSALVATAGAEARSLHRRETGREQPWVRPAANDAFETYEAPVDAPAGRYLWVTLELEGNGRAAPRVRSLRVERPAHDHLRRLPRAFSREPRAADFLQRYLALADGPLSDLGGRAEQRSVLLSPAGAPAEALGWLAGFLGLVLDERWPEPVRRRVIDEAPWLLRFRGTLRGLERLLELLVGRNVIIVERWRLRGQAGALLEGTAAPESAVVGAGLRVGGAVGATGAAPVSDDAFASHAHRFTVLVPALLDAEQLGMVEHALNMHRPAHTLFDMCTLGSGMRVGSGLHVGLLSTIGRTGGWESLAAGQGTLGRGIVGRPGIGTGVGSALLGRQARVG